MALRLACKDIEACSRTFFRRILVCANPAHDRVGIRRLAAFHDKLVNARTVVLATKVDDPDRYKWTIGEYASCVKQETLARITMVVLFKLQLTAADVSFVARHFPNVRLLDMHKSKAAPSTFAALQDLALERIYLRGNSLCLLGSEVLRISERSFFYINTIHTGTDALKVPVPAIAASIACVKVAAFGGITIARELLNGLLRGMPNLEVLWFGSVQNLEDMIPDVRHEKLESLRVCKDMITMMCNPVQVCSSTPTSEIRVAPPGFMRRLADKLPSLTNITGVALDVQCQDVLELLPKFAHRAHCWAAFLSIDESEQKISYRASPEVTSLIIRVSPTAPPRIVQSRLKEIIAKFAHVSRLHIRFCSSHQTAQLSRMMPELASRADNLHSLCISMYCATTSESKIYDMAVCAAMGAVLFARKILIVVPVSAQQQNALANMNAHLENMQCPSRLSIWPSISSI